MTVKLGTPALAVAAYETIWTGVIDSCEPDTTSISIVVTEPAMAVQTQAIIGGWLGHHPWQLVKDILERAGATYTASFTPTSLNGHWNLSRGRFGALGGGSIVSMQETVLQPVKAASLLADLMPFVGGFLRTEPMTGRLELVPYDPAAAAVRHLDAHEIVEVTPLPLWDDLINRCIVKGTAHSDWTQANSLVLERASANAKTFAGGRDRVREESSSWIGAPAQLVSTLAASAGAGSTIIVRGAQGLGFAGTRYDKALNSVGTAAANASLAAGTRNGWLLIEDSSRQFRELIKCSAASPSGTDLDYAWELAANGDWTASRVYRDWEFTVQSRGSPAIPWNAKNATHARVYDATLAMARAESVVSRWGLDFRRLRVRLHSPRHLDLQIGDVVTLDSSVPVNHGVVGVSSLITWQITRAEFDGSSVVLDLAWVRNYAGYTGTITTIAEVLWELDRPLPREYLVAPDGTIVLDEDGYPVRGYAP